MPTSLWPRSPLARAAVIVVAVVVAFVIIGVLNMNVGGG